VRFAPRGGRSLFPIVASLAIAFLFFARAAVAAALLYVYDDLGRLIAAHRVIAPPPDPCDPCQDDPFCA